MYFYNLEGTMMVKYKVELDVAKLKKLKKEIIDNCSEIVNKTYEVIGPTQLFDSEYIKNYKMQKTNRIDFNTGKDIFLVSYDFYNPPYLVILIEQLLLGNTNVINEIKKYKDNFSIDNSNIKEQYESLLSNIYDKEDIKIYGEVEDNSEKERRKLLLKEMENLLTNYENKSKNSTLINEYKLKVLECIDLKIIKTLSLETLLDIQNFFDDSKEETTNKNLHKILQKTLTKE